ncbi:hypothetical protein HZY86_04245 [Aerococcaceae bacterium DSM 111020]|nr:hypothetical protein [Aerococcaceae bacterium DSM 111020]
MLQGEIIEAKIYDENEANYFAQYEGRTFALAKETLEDEFENGQLVEGMYYQDQDQNDRIQLDLPNARLDYFGWGTVQLKRTDIGVFVDIGLYNKDIAVSYDDLPEDTELWPHKGDRLMIRLEVDNKGRLWGKPVRTENRQQMKRKAPARLLNQDVECTVYRHLDVGVQANTNEDYDAFIHESEYFGTLRLGQVVQGRVIDVHADGRINVSLKPRAHEVIEDDAKMILTLLEKIPSHKLPLHDKSKPQDIKNQLGISKGQFKRAIGTLLKNGYIKQTIGEGIELIKDVTKND